MSQEEYDELYRDALRRLAESAQVGEPFVRADGSRICKVGDQLLSEEEVLEKRWGRSIAAIIKRDRWTQHPFAIERSGARDRSIVPARVD
jgi:hypothetical protein